MLVRATTASTAQKWVHVREPNTEIPKRNVAVLATKPITLSRAAPTLLVSEHDSLENYEWEIIRI